jgi:hypothetical protein
VFYPKDKIGVVARMIGNAVPPKLAQFFAEYLVSGEALRHAKPSGDLGAVSYRAPANTAKH